MSLKTVRQSCNLVKEVLVDFYFEDKQGNGDIILTAFALDGRIIQLIKPSPSRIEEYRKGESDGTLQEDYADWLRRRLDNTWKQEVYIPENFRKKSIND